MGMRGLMLPPSHSAHCQEPRHTPVFHLSPCPTQGWLSAPAAASQCSPEESWGLGAAELRKRGVPCPAGAKEAGWPVPTEPCGRASKNPVEPIVALTLLLQSEVRGASPSTPRLEPGVVPDRTFAVSPGPGPCMTFTATRSLSSSRCWMPSSSTR